jgi:uncharacterized protein with FMN-binding domain
MKRIIRNAKKLILPALLAATFTNTVSASGSGERNHTIPAGISLASLVLNDGTFTGTANGFGPGLVVSITVSNGKLSEIQVVTHNEINKRYYDKPIKIIPDAIVGKQNTLVDAVSGASDTSFGIMSAVEDAVKKAIKGENTNAS